MNERNRRERESTAYELNRMNEPEWTEEASDKELPTQPLPRATQMELLAPAGGPAPFTAALAGGADAIYCGLGNTSTLAVVRTTLTTSRLRVRADRPI